MSEVLVTGGAGFIGRHLVARLLAAGRAVTVLDDDSTGSLRDLPGHPSLRVVEGSVLDAGARADAVRSAAEVYHLAAVVGVRLAAREGARAHRVATEGTRAVLDESGGVPVVLFSSSAVYGRRRADRAREDAPVDEADTLDYDGGAPGYATGKLELERLGAEAAAAGRRVLVVRPFNVVGPGQTGAYGMVLPRMIDAALAGEPLTVYDDGRQTRAFSDVDAFLDALFRLVATPAAWGRVFNVGAPRGDAVLDLARLVLAETGRDVPLAFVPYGRAFPGRADVRARVPDPTRLVETIGAVDWPPLRRIVRRVCAERLAAPAPA